MMNLRSFHHPDFCPRVIRRRAAEQLLDFLVETAIVLVSRGRSIPEPFYPSQSAYHSAISRLRKKGLIAHRREGGRPPFLELTEEGEARLPAYSRRRAPWPDAWNGIWYVLFYDVPEKDRPYRDTLRKFLKQMRMGQLQKSVWITPVDIRPEYDDLAKAGGVDQFSFLMESRTVLGRSPADIVYSAWNMDHLEDLQHWYLDVYEYNMEQASSGRLDRETLLALISEESSAYDMAMREDPLLPRPLWPRNYAGERVWRFHRQFIRNLSKTIY